MKRNHLHKLNQAILASALGFTLLATGCARKPAEELLGVPTGDPAATEPGFPGGDMGGYPGGGMDWTTPGDNNQDGYSDLPQQPIDTPEPLPAPSNPVNPGEPMIVRAVSKTTAFALPQFNQNININGVYVYIHLTWQPVNNAAEYWLYKGRMPHFSEARRDLAYAVVPAGFAATGFKDGLEPPNLSGGSLMDKVRRGFQMISNRPGINYEYKVIAVDANGIPMSESPVVNSTPLPAIPAPTLAQPNDLATSNPLFTWADGAQSNVAPDGYYVSVFPSVQFGGGANGGMINLPPTAFAFWTTYRNSNSKLARYGEDSANLTTYPGTLPFNITFRLQAARNYSWTVVAVKTDTGDMKTANAISRSWSGFGHFQIAPNAAPPVQSSGVRNPFGYPANRVPVPGAPRF
jgi:hypothetical protein